MDESLYQKLKQSLEAALQIELERLLSLQSSRETNVSIPLDWGERSDLSLEGDSQKMILGQISVCQKLQDLYVDLTGYNPSIEGAIAKLASLGYEVVGAEDGV